MVRLISDFSDMIGNIGIFTVYLRWYSLWYKFSDVKKLFYFYLNSLCFKLNTLLKISNNTICICAFKVNLCGQFWAPETSLYKIWIKNMWTYIWTKNVPWKFKIGIQILTDSSLTSNLTQMKRRRKGKRERDKKREKQGKRDRKQKT